MEDKKITISGKTIDYGTMNDETVLKLYRELLERNNAIMKKIQEEKAIISEEY